LIHYVFKDISEHFYFNLFILHCANHNREVQGRVIMAPKQLPGRPTTEFAKTALFNFLQIILTLKKFPCLIYSAVQETSV